MRSHHAPYRGGAFDAVYLVAVVHHMPPEAARRALAETKRAFRLVVTTAWASARGREVAPGVYEVRWGVRATRIYYRYEQGDLIAMAPAAPLSAGVARRGRQTNYYMLF